MSQTLSFVAKSFKLLQPQPICCQQMINYCQKIYEVRTVQDNIDFLKTQREQLKELRLRIIKEKDLIREKMIELDEKIETIKKNSERKKLNNN